MGMTPRRWLLVLLTLGLAGCGNLETAGDPVFEPEVPIIEGVHAVSRPQRRAVGDLEVACWVFQGYRKFGPVAEFYDRDLVEGKGWRRRPHGTGYVYRTDTKEVMLLQLDRDTVEIRIAKLVKGRQLPPQPITIGF